MIICAFFAGLYCEINLTLPIVVYTSESARLIMALKRNETNGMIKPKKENERAFHFSK